MQLVSSQAQRSRRFASSWSKLSYRIVAVENFKKYAYENRRFVVIGSVLFVLFVYIVRLCLLQLVDSNYKASADNNASAR